MGLVSQARPQQRQSLSVSGADTAVDPLARRGELCTLNPQLINKPWPKIVVSSTRAYTPAIRQRYVTCPPKFYEFMSLDIVPVFKKLLISVHLAASCGEKNLGVSWERRYVFTCLTSVIFH